MTLFIIVLEEKSISPIQLYCYDSSLSPDYTERPVVLKEKNNASLFPLLLCKKENFNNQFAKLPKS